MKKLARYLRAPIFVWWDITYKCNLRCKQCYSNSGYTAEKELNTQEVKNIIDQLSEIGVFYIYFLGGEPFLRKDFLEIARYTVNSGLGVMVNTNGWFINKALARKIKEIGIHHIRISLDGASPEVHDSIRGVRGSFQKVIQALVNLQQVGIPRIGITPTIMKENFSEYTKLIDIALKYKVTEIQLVQLCHVGRGSKVEMLTLEQINQLRKTLKTKRDAYKEKLTLSASEGVLKRPCFPCIQKDLIEPTIMGCGAGRTCLAITPMGIVNFCLLDRRPVGDLKQQSFKKIWYDSPVLKEKRRIRDVCLECKYAEICARECPLEIGLTDEEKRSVLSKLVKSSKTKQDQPNCFNRFSCTI